MLCRFFPAKLRYRWHPPGGYQRYSGYQQPAKKSCRRRSHERDDQSGLRLTQRMKPPVAQLKNSHDPAAEFFRRNQLKNRAAGGGPDRVVCAEELDQSQRKKKRRGKTEKSKADAVKDCRINENLSVIRAMAHRDEQARADDGAKTASRLQEPETAGADL